MGASIPIAMGWCLGVVPRAAPGSPPGHGCSPLAASLGAEPPSLRSTSILSWQSQEASVWRAMGRILAAPVDVLVQASQHRTPRVVSWKFGSPAYQQCPIIDCPHEVLEMAGIVHVQQGQGIRHASLLHPMPPLSASQCGEARDLIGHYNLLIHAPLLPYLVKDIEKLIQSIQQHLWPVTIAHHILVTQGAELHAGGLERGNACIPPS